MPWQYSRFYGLTISSANWYPVSSNVFVDFEVPQDTSKPPVIFHLFPWVGSMVTYGMEPYKFFINARAKVSHLSKSVLTFSMEITLPLFLEDDECMLL